MSKVKRIVVGFLVAPWLVAIVFTLVSLLLSSGTSFQFRPVEQGFGVLIFVLVLYGGYLVLGLPFLIALRRHGLTRWWHFAVSGAIAGNLVLVALLAISLGKGERFDLTITEIWILVFGILNFGLIGMVAASVLWALIYWRWPRPGHPPSQPR